MSFLTDLAGHIKTWVEANFSASTHNHNLNDLAEKSYNSLTDKPALGEANTASNLGTGEGVFAQKNGVALELKSLVAGKGVSLSNDANEITVSSTSSISDISTVSLSNQSVWNKLDFTNQSAYRVITDDVFMVDEFIDYNTIAVGEEVTIEFDNADYVSHTPSVIFIQPPGGGTTFSSAIVLPKGTKQICKIFRATVDEYNAYTEALYTVEGSDYASLFDIGLVSAIFAGQNLEAGIPVDRNGFPASGDNDVLGVTIDSASVGELVAISLTGVTRIKIGMDITSGETLTVWWGKAYQSGQLNGMFTALSSGTTDSLINVRWT